MALVNKNKQNAKQGNKPKRQKTASKQNGSLALIAGLLLMQHR
jgi:hypothetical protein